MSGTMEARRQRVADLLDAGISIKDIAKIVECSEDLVFKVKRLRKEGKDLKRSPGSGGQNKKRSAEFMADVKQTIENAPTTSMRKMAKAMNVSEATIRRSVKDLGAVSYVRRRRQLLSDGTKQRRVTKGKKLLSWLKSNGSTVRIFSDKKLWTVDQARNARNDRYLAYNVSEVPSINVTKHPASAMMLGVVASDGKRMPPFWFQKGVKIGQKEYEDVLTHVVKPWLDINYPNGGYVFQQDSAPSHMAKKTQTWLRENLADFWPFELWPPSSPDLNPLDFGVWGVVERRACATSHPSVASLKAAVEKEWTDMSEDVRNIRCRSILLKHPK